MTPRCWREARRPVPRVRTARRTPPARGPRGPSIGLCSLFLGRFDSVHYLSILDFPRDLSRREGTEDGTGWEQSVSIVQALVPRGEGEGAGRRRGGEEETRIIKKEKSHQLHQALYTLHLPRHPNGTSRHYLFPVVI